MKRYLANAAALLLTTTSPAWAPPPFWENGTFAQNKPSPGSFILIDTGERYQAWMVVGQNGNVAWTSGARIHNGFHFVAQRPASQTTDVWVNLAAISQSATGIMHHDVPTVVGRRYTLSFYVGNIYDPTGIYGTGSTVAVYQNTTFLGLFTNSGGQGSMNENWKQFTITFAADAPFTSIAFINQDPPGDLNCGLDNVSFSPATITTRDSAS